MEEEEWLASADIEGMLAQLLPMKFPEAEPCNWGNGERKKRLFLSACLRRIWTSLPSEYQAIIELLESQADGGRVSAQSRRKIYSAAEAVRWAHTRLLFYLGYDDLGMICYTAANLALEATTKRKRGVRDAEVREQATLLREIFGNPFREVKFIKKWRTSTVMQLARGIYDNRNFTDLPILADALQDAGCDSDDILNHFRDVNATHVRGCWALDLVLGKE